MTLGENVSPLCSVYDSGTGEVFVASTNSSISVISDKNNNVVARIPNITGELAYDSGTHEIFAADWTGNLSAVSVISDKTNAVVATVPLKSSLPLCLVYDSGKGQILVAQDGLISVLSDSSNASLSPSSTVPELSCLVILPLFLSVFFIAVVLRHQKTKN